VTALLATAGESRRAEPLIVSCGDPREVTRMNRLKLLLALATSVSAVAVLVFPATLSAADGGPTKVAVTDDQQSFSFRAGRVCTFPLTATPVQNNQFIKTYPADANGDVRVAIEGVLKEQVTNVATGKSIVVNVSGPETEIVHPDGSAELTSGGSFLVLFNARFNPLGPHTYIYTGHTVISISDDGVLTPVSTTDKDPFDVCAALS
jgi:hypothetical protein